MITLSRRRILGGGLASLLFAPAIVRSANLMAVKAWAEPSVLPLAGGGTGATPIAVRNALLTSEAIAREAMRILERNLIVLDEISA